MAKFDPPAKFFFKANEWDSWIQEFQRFRTASKLNKEDGDVQRDSLLYCMAEQLMATFKWGKICVPNPAKPD